MVPSDPTDGTAQDLRSLEEVALPFNYPIESAGACAVPSLKTSPSQAPI